MKITVFVYLSVVLFTLVYFSKIRRNPFSQQTFTTDADQGEQIKWQVSLVYACVTISKQMRNSGNIFLTRLRWQLRGNIPADFKTQYFFTFGFYSWILSPQFSSNSKFVWPFNFFYWGVIDEPFFFWRDETRVVWRMLCY